MAAPCSENNQDQNHAADSGKLKFSLEVPFPSATEANIAFRSLQPDKEPRKGGISRDMTVSGCVMSVRWSAEETRILRVSVNSFLDNLTLVMETMEAFGPPVVPL